MKVSFLALGASLLAVTFALCPFQEMKRSGQLTEEDAAKFEAVKRDPKAAEALFEAYQRERREAAPELVSRGLIGPTNGSGLLDLPYGGGLRKSTLWSYVWKKLLLDFR